ncbi:TRAP transporter substrate-binding protein [Chelativorans sp. YIM 93263]|uniref:TRAP transporter substrate-binding protein n=1 Tax=Chelativorans sp. YIM 93263 TaxID=2906648 RepID=UPI002379EDAD|nr:TRAP transporter substrate-binding protein [Chelativorans sp. YIM 93263]
MRNGIFGLLMAGAALTLLPSPSSAAEFEIRASHVEAADSAVHRGWSVFEAFVENASGGRIEVTILPASQLGGLNETLEQTSLGIIQVAQADESTLDPFHKPMMILGAPYLFADDEEAKAFIASDYFDKMRRGMIEESNLRVLTAASYGFRSLTNDVRPIKTVEDLQGLRIRVPPSPLSIEMIKAMGANPTPIPWEELYGAMEQGVVDGQENPIGLINDYSFSEVQKYLTVDNHKIGLNFMVINESFFQSLPIELREAVLVGAEMAAATEYGERNYQSRVSAVSQLEEKGMEVYFPTPEELATFRDAAKEPVKAFLTEELGETFVTETYEELDRIREARAAKAM